MNIDFKGMSKQEIFDHLNHIITTQEKLSEANFDIDFFMNLVVEQVQKLTKATGVVVELVEGDDMVYRAATGTVANHVGLHLTRKGSLSGLCVEKREVLRSDDTELDSRVNLAAVRKVGARSMVVTPLFYQGKLQIKLLIKCKSVLIFKKKNSLFLLV